MKDRKVTDISSVEAGLPDDGSVWFIGQKKGEKFIIDIRQPETVEEVELLLRELGTLFVATALQMQDSPFACHAGCAFAMLIDGAREQFQKADPVEYERALRVMLKANDDRRAAADATKH